MHWPLYEGMRRGLRELLRARPEARDHVVVGAVSYVGDPEFAVHPFLEVIDAVPGLEKLDLAIVGGMRGGQRARFDGFAAHRAASRLPGVRALGATFHDRTAALPLLAGGDADIAFIRYNAAHRGAEEDVFARAPQTRRGLLYNFKSTMGHVPEARFEQFGYGTEVWRPSVSDHYRFVLSQAQLDGVLCAPQDLRELAELEHAIGRGPLSDEELAFMKCASDLHAGRIRLKAS